MREFKKRMTDVADSDKDRNTEKGFRGIGRLAGLGYCDRLIFETSALGENKKSVIVWDGIKLRDIVNDSKQHPTSDELIESITEIKYEDVDEDEHFFEVIMEDIIFESDDLLDEEQVGKYLSSVAPVPYASHFIYASRIHEFANEHNFRIDEYEVSVNGNPLHKPYHSRLKEGSADSPKTYDEIIDIKFKIFNDDKGNPIAWMWYGITKFEKNIPVVNEMRCIRLRKENIQIGGEDTIGYPKFFREPRGNGYYIGEVFAVDSNLIPNARRDYFNPNPATKQFERVLHYFFYEKLYELYHYASKVRSARKTITNFQKREAEYQEKLNNAGFINSDERDEAQKGIEEERAKAEKAEREINNRRKDADSNDVFGRVFNAIEDTYKVKEETQKPNGENKVNISSDDKKQQYMTQTLSKYGKKEQKLISKIYGNPTTTLINIIAKFDLYDKNTKAIKVNI